MTQCKSSASFFFFGGGRGGNKIAVHVEEECYIRRKKMYLFDRVQWKVASDGRFTQK